MSSLNKIDTQASNLLAHSADETQKENADFQEKSGLEVRVTRVYDDVGVHDGKDVCLWCKSRCGQNMTLDKAYEIGAFQRHPGCGCRIEYTSNRGVKTIQTGKYSGWNFADELEKRKSIGLDEGFFANELESRISRYSGVNKDELVKNAESGLHHSTTYQQAFNKPRPQLEKSIRKHIQQAEEHEWKIQHPEYYMTRADPNNEKERARAIEKWNKDRRRNSQIAFLELAVWRRLYE